MLLQILDSYRCHGLIEERTRHPVRRTRYQFRNRFVCDHAHNLAPAFCVGDLLTFLEVGLPAVPHAKSVMEEVIAFPPRNLEADESEAFPRDNRLPTFAAGDGCPEFHCSPSPPCLLFLMHVVHA